MPGVKWRWQPISRVFAPFPAAARGGDGASGNGHLTDRSLPPPPPPPPPAIPPYGKQETTCFHQRQTGRGSRRKSCSSCACSRMQLARPRPDFSTAGGASGSADVCSCRAAPPRCMFCRGGGAADSGGLEHVSCCGRLLQDPTRAVRSRREGGKQQGGAIAQ